MHNEEANNLELSAGNQCSLPEVSVTHSFHLTSPSLSMQTDRHFFQQENKIFEREQECDSHLLLGGTRKSFGWVYANQGSGWASVKVLYIIEKDPPMTWTNTVTIPRTLRVWIQCQQGKHDNLSKKRDPQNPCPGRRLIPLYSPYTGVTPSPLGEGLWTEI